MRSLTGSHGRLSRSGRAAVSGVEHPGLWTVSIAMANEPRTLGDIADRLEDAAGGGDAVTVGDVVHHVGTRSFGPFLIVPALVELSPVGGIPGAGEQETR